VLGAGLGEWDAQDQDELVGAACVRVLGGGTVRGCLGHHGCEEYGRGGSCADRLGWNEALVRRRLLALSACRGSGSGSNRERPLGRSKQLYLDGTKTAIGSQRLSPRNTVS
jgi:hypothetical protein